MVIVGFKTEPDMNAPQIQGDLVQFRKIMRGNDKLNIKKHHIYQKQ